MGGRSRRSESIDKGGKPEIAATTKNTIKPYIVVQR